MKTFETRITLIYFFMDLKTYVFRAEYSPFYNENLDGLMLNRKISPTIFFQSSV